MQALPLQARVALPRSHPAAIMQLRTGPPPLWGSSAQDRCFQAASEQGTALASASGWLPKHRAPLPNCRFSPRPAPGNKRPLHPQVEPLAPGQDTRPLVHIGPLASRVLPTAAAPSPISGSAAELAPRRRELLPDGYPPRQSLPCVAGSALESCLWDLVAMRAHSLPLVSLDSQGPAIARHCRFQHSRRTTGPSRSLSNPPASSASSAPPHSADRRYF